MKNDIVQVQQLAFMVYLHELNISRRDIRDITDPNLGLKTKFPPEKGIFSIFSENVFSGYFQYFQ